MKCESCGENEAKFHYTKIYNGNIEEKHLCEHCASEDYDFDFDFEKHFSINKFFTGLIDPSGENSNDKSTLKCEKCGQTYNEFKSSGKFGCDECYVTFKDKLDPLIKGIHGHIHHRGKIPKHSNDNIFLKREKDNLKNDLETAIKEERFEKAAVLRDKLKGISSKLEEIKE
nr:UvrB/UvrC motif-containing protein [Tissierella sp.]